MNPVTYAEVEEALNELVKVKKSLTLSNLRQQLGDRGSMTTLTKYLNQWKSLKFIDNIPSQSIVEPAPDHIMTAVQTVWHQMVGHGQEQLAQYQLEFQQKELEWEAKLQELRLNFDQVKKAYSVKEDEYRDLQQKYTQLFDSENKLKQQCMQLTESLHQEKEFSQQLAQNYQQEKSFLEKNYFDRLKELKESYDLGRKQSEREIDNLKTLMEQQRHEHLLAFDQLTFEHKELLLAYQQQKTQESLKQESDLLSKKLIHDVQELQHSQNLLLKTTQMICDHTVEIKKYYATQQFFVDCYQTHRSFFC
jgi:DNA repair exonuclease SbcCD ATPase subunit